MTGWAPRFGALVQQARHRALHLELRDTYGGSHAFAAWSKGVPHDRSAADKQWYDLLEPLVSVHGDVRRARIISEPVTDYIRFEHEVTPLANLAAGEQVRWLPRREASTLALPGNDFWLIDDVLLFNIFSGEGAWTGADIVNDENVAAFCEMAFEEVWKRATDHADFRIT